MNSVVNYSHYVSFAQELFWLGLFSFSHLHVNPSRTNSSLPPNGKTQPCLN